LKRADQVSSKTAPFGLEPKIQFILKYIEIARDRVPLAQRGFVESIQL